MLFSHSFWRTIHAFGSSSGPAPQHQEEGVELGDEEGGGLYYWWYPEMLSDVVSLMFNPFPVGGLERSYLFVHILGIIIPIDFHIFRRGR